MRGENMKKLTAWLIVVAVCLAVSVSFALLAASVNLSFQGKIVGIGVSVSSSYLVWGNVEQGSFNSQTVTLADSGNADEVLSMSVTDLPSYLVLTWNCSGAVLTPSVGCVALFTLAVAANASLGTFAFTITVTGEET